MIVIVRIFFFYIRSYTVRSGLTLLGVYSGTVAITWGSITKCSQV